MEPTIKCHYCGSEKVKYVFKAHSPLYYMGSVEINKRNKKWAHWYNIFLCSKCAGDGPQAGYESRYLEVRFVDRRPDTLSDTWEKEWTLLYDWGNKYVFVEPKKEIYYIDRQ